MIEKLELNNDKEPVLLRCPFCGSIPEREHKSHTQRNEHYTWTTDKYRIRCSNCFCGTGWLFDEVWAEEQWNRRAET